MGCWRKRVGSEIEVERGEMRDEALDGRVWGREEMMMEEEEKKKRKRKTVGCWWEKPWGTCAKAEVEEGRREGEEGKEPVGWVRQALSL